jgi:hypothetical protein
MAAGQQDLSSKKSNFLSNCVQAGVALKAVRDQLRQLAEAYDADATYSGIAQGDIVGTNAHLTPAILANFLTVVQPAVESVVAAHLANLLDVLPS